MKLFEWFRTVKFNSDTGTVGSGLALKTHPCCTVVVLRQGPPDYTSFPPVRLNVQ